MKKKITGMYSLIKAHACLATSTKYMYLEICLFSSEVCSDKYLRMHFYLLKYGLYFTFHKVLGFSPNVHVGGLDDSRIWD